MTAPKVFLHDKDKIRQCLTIIRHQSTADFIEFIDTLDNALLGTHLIMANGEQMTLTDCAAIHGNFEALKELHQRGASIKRSLVSIFGSCNTEILNYLIEQNAFLANAKDSKGLTPLQNLLVQYKRHPEKRRDYEHIALTMIHCGANPHLPGLKDVTPLEMAKVLRHCAIDQIFEASHSNVMSH